MFPICVKHLVYTMLEYSIVCCHQAPSSLLCELQDTLECGICVGRQIDLQHIAMIQFKQCEPSCGADIAVQRKLYHRAFSCPVLLVVVNGRLEYLADRLVHSLGCTICLRMECGGHEELGPHEQLKFTPEYGHEL
jgi:hypothetical protein